MLGNIGSTTAQAGERHYPKGWTWKQEKLKHYTNGSAKPYWMPKIWFAIAACEQPFGRGTMWTAYSAGYEGAFGFAHRSWDGYKPAGYPDSASQASTWQQYHVARILYSHFGYSPWGCFTGGGYKYHM